ncbi:Imm8 family immunity protein [Anabaena sp. CCY 0017]|uniref:Imm8 family immunity protein n=1 Tax=Anabaena sp. CCY 0017 TaxID=3103866 RepID=UPI0039C5AB7E
MKQAELQMLISPDMLDMEQGEPENPYNFSILVQALIGIASEEGADTFNIIVCTPDWLKNRIPAEGYIIGRAHLIVARYDYGVIKKAIESWCEKAKGKDWNEIVNILAKYSQWEYESL